MIIDFPQKVRVATEARPEAAKILKFPRPRKLSAVRHEARYSIAVAVSDLDDVLLAFSPLEDDCHVLVERFDARDPVWRALGLPKVPVKVVTVNGSMRRIGEAMEIVRVRYAAS